MATSTAGARRVRGPGRCAASTSTRVSSSTRANARGSSDCAGTARVRHSASSAGALLPDGRVAYRLKKPRRNGATHLVMTPVQFLARIAILIPPPRYPLQRFAGVLAPHSSWRRAVVAVRPPRSSHGPASRPGHRPRRRRQGRRRTPRRPRLPVPRPPREQIREHARAAGPGPREHQPRRRTPHAVVRPHGLGCACPARLPLRRPRLSLRRSPHHPRGRKVARARDPTYDDDA